MQNTPKSSRLHIALLGRVNSGKSSFLNLLIGQNVSITSDMKGTTTDVVEKVQELSPLGPVVWLDTAGFDDDSTLGLKRIEKTMKALERADVIVLVCEGAKIGTVEEKIISDAAERNLPLIKVYNKKDLFLTKDDGLSVNSINLSSRDDVLNEFKAKLIEAAPEGFFEQPKLLGDLAFKKSTVILVTPIDLGAPKGRMILPQVHALRDCLDSDQLVYTVKETEYSDALNNLKTRPALVVCDSQVVERVASETPKEIPLTTFSILFARLKGDIDKFIDGAKQIKKLKDGDKVLISEACTHHASTDDIGKVKIPKWLKEYTGKNLEIHHSAGHDFPNNLEEYKLVIHCGGCMFNRREILSRLNVCEKKNVPITNYGVAISEMKGILPRVIEPLRKRKSHA